MREVTTDDINAAVRGLSMWGMTGAELRELRELHTNAALFAGRVIHAATEQVLAAKAFMGRAS